MCSISYVEQKVNSEKNKKNTNKKINTQQSEQTYLSSHKGKPLRLVQDVSCHEKLK